MLEEILGFNSYLSYCIKRNIALVKTFTESLLYDADSPIVVQISNLLISYMQISQ